MKDRFSQYAADYAAFRPTYPKELYDFILSHVNEKQSAWDCGTGNGQVARDLAPHFQNIYATDISAKQIENGIKVPNIHYTVSPAEKTAFPDSTFDLITVAQAIHWFDIPKFYEEVRRVAKPGAILAVWGYGLLKINPEIDELISDFYVNVIGSYWDAERKLIDEHYRTVPFPFERIPTPEFKFSFEWSIDELQGYLTTWSSVQKYIAVRGDDPVALLIKKLNWGGEKMTVNFPLFLLSGRIKK